MTPFVGGQYVRLMQQSVVAATVNDGRVGCDLVLREESDGISSLVQDIQFSLKSKSVLRGVNSSVLGNDTLDVSLGRRHKPKELYDELDLLSGVLEQLQWGLGLLALLLWDRAPFPVLKLRCGQRLLQDYPGLFHAVLFHKFLRVGVETQTRHSHQHQQCMMFSCVLQRQEFMVLCPTSLTYRNLARTRENKLKLHLVPGVARINFRWRMWR